MTRIDLQGIKAIIFDLGGVILNIDYKLTETAFENIGITNFAELFSQASQTKLFDRFEKGEISPEQFRTELCHMSKLNLDHADIDNAWNAMLLDLPKERLQLLRTLKQDYKTFLLSNTNKVHIDQFTKTTIQRDDLEDLFHRVYLSSEIKMRKPDVTTFQYVLKENDLSPSETLFIDDSIQHIEGAKKAGINAFYLPKGVTINSLF